MSRSGDRQIRHGLLAFHRHYLHFWLVAVFAHVSTAAITGIVGLKIKEIVDNGINTYFGSQSGGGGAGGLNRQMLIYACLLGVLALTRALGASMTAGVTQSVSRDLRSAIFDRVSTRDVGFFEFNSASEVQTCLLVDINALQVQSASFFSQLLGSGPIAVVGVAMMLRANWRWAILFLLSQAAIGACGAWALARVQLMAAKAQAKLALVGTDCCEVVRNIRVVRVDNQLEGHRERFQVLLREHFRAARSVHGLRTAINGASWFTGSLVLVGIVWWGLRGAAPNETTVGDIVAFWFCAGFATTALVELLGVAASYREAVGCFQRTFKLLESPTSSKSQPTRVVTRPAAWTIRGDLSIRELCFDYPGKSGASALRGVSIELRSGTRAGLVGRSGSGKSTLLDLIVGLRTPSKGVIMIDGRDISTWDLTELWSSVALVQQDVALFRGSLADNIRYARPGASAGAVRAAAEAACAHDFIERLPQGYDTLLGEAAQLSGGEKQRIAIARAILKDPRLLLLDEATSALDGHTEMRVRQGLATLMKGRTVLFATHRLANVVDMDLILLLQEGRLTAVGPHDHLLRTSRWYADLARAQFCGELAGSSEALTVAESAPT